MVGVGRDLKAQLIPQAGMLPTRPGNDAPEHSQSFAARRQFQGCAWPGTCSCGSSLGAPAVPSASRAWAVTPLPVPGDGSCHRIQIPLLPSPPPAAPAPAQVLLSAHSCPTQAPGSPSATSVTPQAPRVTPRPLCPSLMFQTGLGAALCRESPPWSTAVTVPPCPHLPKLRGAGTQAAEP